MKSSATPNQALQRTGSATLRLSLSFWSLGDFHTILKFRMSMNVSRRCLIAGALLATTTFSDVFPTRAMAQPDISDLAEQDFKKADARLNTVYKELLKAITRSDTRDNLIQAQRAWVEFRDAEAELRTSLGNKGGIVYAYGRTVAQTELTKERIQQLLGFKASLEKSK